MNLVKVNGAVHGNFEKKGREHHVQRNKEEQQNHHPVLARRRRRAHARHPAAALAGAHAGRVPAQSGDETVTDQQAALLRTH